jgi:hypothetical protein
MKTSYKSILLKACAAGVMVLALASCRKDFDNINTNPNSPAGTERLDFIMTGAQKGLMDNTWDAFWGAQVGNQLAQYWSSNQYATESRYQFRTGVTNSYWNLLYSGGSNDAGYSIGGLSELQEIINKCTESPSEYAAFGDPNNQIAIATILKVWAMQQITDTWGMVPYSEALKGAAVSAPKYDTQREIYLGLLDELNGAMGKINESAAVTCVGDVIYSGDMSAWRKFANSLKMRVAIRIADRESEIASEAINAAIADGIFTSNADNALFHYLDGQPNFSMYYYNRYFEGRIDYAGSNTMIDVMNGLSDPRISQFFNPSVSSGTYVGEVYGLTDADATATANDDVSQRSDKVLSADFPGIYMAFAETQFILAEAVERGFISGNAADYYNAGIAASFDYWEAGDATDYIASAGVDYATLIGGGQTWKQAIGKQKWISLYMQGFEGWAEWRRLDFGILQLPNGPLLDGTGIPVRMKYPFSEQTLNGANYNAALSAQGPDELSTKLWWDVN